jgi:hypothetical protein
MEASIVRRPRNEKGRTRRLALALGACAAALGFATPGVAQSIESKPARAAAREDTKRARTMRPDRTESLREAVREESPDAYGAGLEEGQGDIPFLEGRIRDLSAKVRELNELLQRQKEALAPVRFTLRPMRVTLRDRDRTPRVAKTYGEALDVHLRERARQLRTALIDPAQRQHLAFEVDDREAQHLLEPVDAGLGAAGDRNEVVLARMRAAIYLTLLEARAHVETAEPLPALHKVLRDLHVDRAALTEHLRRSFLLDRPAASRDLATVLAATAAMYPEPSGARDFLAWLAEGLASDLKNEAVVKSTYAYRGDPQAQFDAAAENANLDNGEVIKLQIELQRLHALADTLRTHRRVDAEVSDDWQYRLVQAERELDRLLRSADVEREAVMTLTRRVPVRREPPTPIAAPAPELLSTEPAEPVASDDLTTQH